jgi:hypothetical protein
MPAAVVTTGDADRLRALLAEITPLPWRLGESPNGHSILWQHSRHSTVAKVYSREDGEYLCLAANALPGLLDAAARDAPEILRLRNLCDHLAQDNKRLAAECERLGADLARASGRL